MHSYTTSSAPWPQPQNIQRIRQTMNALRLSEREAGEIFYGRLFEVAPAVRPLFPESIEDQAEKLFKTLKVLVASLDRLQAVVPVLHEMGRRHIRYGAKPEHYQVVGSVLLWTLREALGETFTAEAEADWARLYAIASGAMVEGAAAAECADEGMSVAS